MNVLLLFVEGEENFRTLFSPESLLVLFFEIKVCRNLGIPQCGPHQHLGNITLSVTDGCVTIGLGKLTHLTR